LVSSPWILGFCAARPALFASWTFDIKEETRNVVKGFSAVAVTDRKILDTGREGGYKIMVMAKKLETDFVFSVERGVQLWRWRPSVSGFACHFPMTS
jgi:hypothetical protein